MKNISFYCFQQCVLLVISFFFITDSHAGNLSIIEKRIKELDALNKQAIRKVTEVPRNGTIHTVLDIPYGNNIEKVTVKSLSIDTGPTWFPFTIQISSSTDRDRTLEVAKKMRELNFTSFVSTPFQHNGSTWWRIYIGSYQSIDMAQEAQEAFQRQSLPEGFITKKPYAIQVGKKIDKHDASVLDNYLQEKGYLPYRAKEDKSGLVKMLIGAFSSEDEAMDGTASLSDITLPMSVVLR